MGIIIPPPQGLFYKHHDLISLAPHEAPGAWVVLSIMTHHHHLQRAPKLGHLWERLFCSDQAVLASPKSYTKTQSGIKPPAWGGQPVSSQQRVGCDDPAWAGGHRWEPWAQNAQKRADWVCGELAKNPSPQDHCLSPLHLLVLSLQKSQLHSWRARELSAQKPP